MTPDMGRRRTGPAHSGNNSNEIGSSAAATTNPRVRLSSCDMAPGMGRRGTGANHSGNNLNEIGSSAAATVNPRVRLSDYDMTHGMGRRGTGANHSGNNSNEIGSSAAATANPRVRLSSYVAKKSGRERAANNMLVEFLKRGGQRPRIEFPTGLTRPVGPWDKEWVTELGITTRKWVPLKCLTWKKVTDAMKTTVFEKIHIRRIRCGF